MAITYEATKLHNTTTVKLDGKRAGFIRQDENGYAYFPASTPKKGGDYFPTLAACKRSIEGTDEDAQGFDDMSVTRVVVAGEPIVTVGMMREAQADSMPWCDPCGSYHFPTAPGCKAKAIESTLAQVAEKMRSIRVHRVQNAIFIPLPPELWRSPDNGCICPTCKRDGTTGYWDTLAVSMLSPEGQHDLTWTVHYPELHSLEVRKAMAIPKV